MIYYDLLRYFTEDNGYFQFITAEDTFVAESENDYPYINQDYK